MRVAFINPQGNFDKNDSYWTTHPDFGGQLVYVKEVASAMSEMGINCDIITRRVIDDKWPEFAEELDSYRGKDSLRIIRIPFGPEGFLSKERLWPFLGEFARRIREFYSSERTLPSFVTTHYGDGGLTGAMLFKETGIPYSFTAHSLGAQKLDKLLQTGADRAEIESRFNFSFRIAAERISMKYSAVNFVSTSMERFQQYSHRLYRDFSEVGNDSKYSVVPPGVNTDIFAASPTELDTIIEKRYKEAVEKFSKPSRLQLPMIIISSRLEQKKNHMGVVRAFSSDGKLNSSCNLIIVTRGLNNPYDEYKSLQEPDRTVLGEIIDHIFKNNLEERVLFMNIENQLELSALYRIGAKRRSVFALTSLYEPFGLAPIEAMACGLPAVATSSGGPTESMRENNVEYGVLVDPLETDDIARGLKRVLFTSEDFWNELSSRGIDRVTEKYTWRSTAEGYLNQIKEKIRCEYPEPEIPDYLYSGDAIPFIE
ncbi:sucrose-phosphate synthase [Mesotoga sp. SC_4PWA21]|nr:sucrose-phosphate synthase [Mesotoga sp. SC_4PWA21]